MKFLNHLLRKHWLLLVLLLLVLWLLPKLINAYAYLFQSLAAFVESFGRWFRVPVATVRAIQDGINKAGRKLADNPALAWIVPGLFFFSRNGATAAAVLTTWGILDLFKPEETITVTRPGPAGEVPTTGAVTGGATGAAVGTAGAVVDDFGNFFSTPQ